jgi:hypothetical protein
MYKDHPVWVGHDSEKGKIKGWYSKIQHFMMNEYKSEAIEANMNVKKDSYPIGRAVTSEIVSHLLSKNTTDDVEKSFMIALMLSSVGRASELSLASFKQCEWNTIHDVMEITWNQKQTSSQQKCCFLNDAKDYNLDVYFLIFLSVT